MRLSFDLGTLVLYDPPEGFIPPACFQWDGRVDRWRTQAHHYRQVVETLRRTRQRLYERRAGLPYADPVQSFDPNAAAVSERRA